MHGLNITMPLKGEAWALAEKTTLEGETSGSINALRYREGRVEGHSGDVVAFREVLELEPFASLDVVHVLGAGGSARAALAAVTDQEVYVTARSEERASAVTERFGRGSVLPWGTSVAGALVINATPIGMKGETLPAGIVEVSAGLIDLPYRKGTTPAAAESAGRHRPTVDGLEFLARQAAESFSWWTGKSVNLEVLTRAARNA
jgi:shikimate dehydrogenase